MGCVLVDVHSLQHLAHRQCALAPPHRENCLPLPAQGICDPRTPPGIGHPTRIGSSVPSGPKAGECEYYLTPFPPPPSPPQVRSI